MMTILIITAAIMVGIGIYDEVAARRRIRRMVNECKQNRGLA